MEKRKAKFTKEQANLLTNETIQIQQRRQVILNGLMYCDDESESEREENIQKLEILLEEKSNLPTIQRTEPSAQWPKVSSKRNSKHSLISPKTLSPIRRASSSQRPLTANIAPFTSHPPAFSPKWADYDVMRHRWHYIQPQTKRLIHEEEDVILIPQSPQNSTVHIVNGFEITSIQGNYFDAENYTSRASIPNSYGSHRS